MKLAPLETLPSVDKVLDTIRAEAAAARARPGHDDFEARDAANRATMRAAGAVTKRAAAFDLAASAVHAKRGDLNAARAKLREAVSAGDRREMAAWSVAVPKAQAALAAAEEIARVEEELLREAKSAAATAEATVRRLACQQLTAAVVEADAAARLAIHDVTAFFVDRAVAPIVRLGAAIDRAGAVLGSDHPEIVNVTEQPAPAWLLQQLIALALAEAAQGAK